MTESFDPIAAEPDETSIDDALETDRVDDGTGLDEDRDRGADESVAAEQGNRDEDRMEADVDDEQLDQLAREDGGLDEILPEQEPPLP